MKALTVLKRRISAGALKKPAGWAGIAAVSAAHVFALWLVFVMLPESTSGWLFPLLLLLPGVVTMTLLPGGWKRWYRWAALFGLVLNSLEPFVVILIADVWILHRSWMVERTVPVRDLFRRRKRQEPATASAKKSKGFRTPKPV